MNNSNKIGCIYKIKSLIKPEKFYIGSAIVFQNRKDGINLKL